MSDTFPLPSIFEALRKSGFFLGIGEYFAVLEALHAGFRYDEGKDVWDKENVLRLCEMLWLKPNQSRFEFRNIFEDSYAAGLKPRVPTAGMAQPAAGTAMPGASDPPDTAGPSVHEEQESPPQPERRPAKTKSVAPKEGKYRLKVELTGTAAQDPKLEVPDAAAKRKSHFLFTEDYFGVSERQLLQVSRLLPVFRATQGSRHIDLPGTVSLWAKRGAFTQLVYQPNKVLGNRVVLLIDNKGSMGAFEALGDKLGRALQQAFGTERPPSYYFYNVPHEYVYLDKAHVEYEETARFLEGIGSQPTLVMLLSDAGAVRGGNSDERFKATLRFLFRLKSAAHQVVWLNPLPQARWERTTAMRIAQFVTMYPFTSIDHYQKAVNALKGNQRWK